jgi:hypothetical protein
MIVLERLRSFAPGLAVALALAPAACAATTTATAAPARDTFAGTLKGTSGGARGGHAHDVLIIATRGQGAQRRLTLTLRPTTCSGKGPCIRTSGVLHGTITAKRSRIADTGTTYVVHASGRLDGLGKTTASGTVQGTGFIARGREGMSLTLKTAVGMITVSAHSRPVPGFTSP